MIGKVIAATVMLMSVPAFAAPTFTQSFQAGPTTVLPTFAYNVTTVGQGNFTLTATSRKFNIAPTTLTNLSDTADVGLVVRSTRGLGILGGTNDLIDTNNPGTAANPRYEGLLISSSRAFSLHSFKLGGLDANDTMQLYGVDQSGALTSLGFGGTILGGLGGAALTTVINSPTSATFKIGSTALFSGYLFTTRIVSSDSNGQGYSLAEIAGAVPEPASWALLITGFGIAGVSLRRRRATVEA
jgi:PEP-CTERM motif